MKKLIFLSPICAFACSVWSLEVSIVADRSSCVYRIGETARMSVTFTEKDGSTPTGGVVKAILDNYGEKEIFDSRSLDLSKTNRFEFAHALPYAGFLRLRLGHPDLPKLPQCHPDWYYWGVAFSPEQIVPSAENPSDFDAYWQGEKARLEREVALDAQMEPTPELDTVKHSFYRVSFATFGGKRIYGWLTIPKESGQGPFPVFVQVPGAGCGSWTNRPLKHDGAISLFLTVFNWQPDPTPGHPKAMAKFYAEKDRINRENHFANRADTVGYPRSGCQGGRDGYFYHDVWLGINRAIDWMAARADVDKSRFFYEGTSQGGAAGLALGCLNTNFTRIAVYVPAMTDMLGNRINHRQCGWPNLVNYQCDDERRAAAEKLAPYYDGANFARRITAPIRFVVGFADSICPPHAVYAAYNACSSMDKEITDGIGMTHDVFGKYYNAGFKWLTSPIPANIDTPDLEAAFAAAKKNGKKVLAIFTAGTDDKAGKAFANQVLSNDSLAKIANDRDFILSLVDAPSKDSAISQQRLAKNRAAVKKHGVIKFPAILLFDNHQKIIACVGYENGDASSIFRQIDESLESQRLCRLHLIPFQDEIRKIESDFADGYAELIDEDAESRKNYLRNEGAAYVKAIKDVYRRFSEAQVPDLIKQQKKWMDENIMQPSVRRANREISR